MTNLNVEIDSSDIGELIGDAVDLPLSELRTDMEEYVDAAVELHVDSHHDDDKPVGFPEDVAERLDDLTARLENIESTVTSLYLFKKIMAKESTHAMAMFHKLRSLMGEFVQFHPPVDDSQSTTIVCSNSYYGEDVSNDDR